MNKTFGVFFRRVTAGEKPGYPRFKGVGHFDTVEFPKDGDGCRWNFTPHDTQARVRLHGVGHVRVHQHRPVQGRVKTVSVKREGTRWFVVLSCDDVPTDPLAETGRGVNARNTSRTCPDCRHVDSENRVNQAHFMCVQCGYTGNADVVGAVNVALRTGLVLHSST